MHNMSTARNEFAIYSFAYPLKKEIVFLFLIWTAAMHLLDLYS